MKSKNCSLKIGMKIEIEIFKEDKEIAYPSQLLDIKSPNEYKISGPIVKNELIPLHNGEKIIISYIIKDKGKHYFSAEITDRKYKGIYILTIKKMSNIKKIQKRKYYRLLENIPISIQYKKQDVNAEKTIVEKCESKDISGGGMKIYSNKLHKVGDEVACSINLLDEKMIIKCKVVRIEAVDSFNYKHLIGLEYKDIDDKYRDTIIKYIFKKQRKLRLKGLI